MASSSIEEELNPKSTSEEEESPIEKDDNEDEAAEEETKSSSLKYKVNNFFDRLRNEHISIRVHDVIIKGNIKTKDALFEPDIETIKKATTVQELFQAASVVNGHLESLEIFDGVHIVLDSGPPELPGTANVIVEVMETKSPIHGSIGLFNKSETRSWSLEGMLRLKNLLGYGDIWDAKGAYGLDQASEISAGISLPRSRELSTPLTARILLLSQDWLKMSSYKERSLGFSLGLFSTRHHDLSYNLAWRNLTDPSQMSSRSIRKQLGHSLISCIKYRFNIDTRDSPIRPTHGYAFISSTQLGGLAPDSRSLRFLRQEFDLRRAFPLGFYNAALNLGFSVGAIFPWGRGFTNLPSPLCERFFLGSQFSQLYMSGSPTTLLGFKTRGLGPTEPRRLNVDRSDKESLVTSPRRDYLGGDLALTAFADLSFDLPLKVFRKNGIHGHLFACTGNMAKLTENEYRNFSLQKFRETFRASAGAGIIIPTEFFRMEINYCYILKQMEHDRCKTGIQFSFSSAQ